MCFVGLNLHDLRDQGIREIIQAIRIFCNTPFLPCLPSLSPPAHKLLIAFWLILVLLPNIDLMAGKTASSTAG